MSEHKKLKYTKQLMVLLWLLVLLLVNTGLCNVARSYKGFDSCSMYAYGSTVLYKHYMYEASGCRHQVLHVSAVGSALSYGLLELQGTGNITRFELRQISTTVECVEVR